MSQKKIRTLLFSTLYPSSVRPVHGIFVETRLRELLKSGQVETRVVAPVPWFPLKDERFGEYGKFAATPRQETWNGIEVHHPRYFLPPKVGMNIAPFSMARAALPTIRRLIADGFDFDLIDAHYYYPDGVAAGIIAEKLGKPFVVTARGSDLNVIAEFDSPRRQITHTAAMAFASVGVSKSLMDKLASTGADHTKLNVLRNGVDLERFLPVDRKIAREKTGLPLAGCILLSVGRLDKGKGHHFVIEALKQSPGTILVIIGSGVERERLQQLASQLGVENRVKFAGQVPNEQLKYWYSAADALVLFSEREGWANVLLESMACGTPVISSQIPGTIEVVTDPAGGLLIKERTVDALTEGISSFFKNLPERDETRAYAARFGWESTTQGQLNLFKNSIQKGSAQ